MAKQFIGASQQQKHLPLHVIIRRSRLIQANAQSLSHIVRQDLELTNDFFDGLEESNVESIDTNNVDMDSDMSTMYENFRDSSGVKMQGDGAEWMDIPEDRKAYLATQADVLEDAIRQIDKMNLSSENKEVAYILLHSINEHGFIDQPERLHEYLSNQTDLSVSDIRDLHDSLKDALLPKGLLCANIQENLVRQIEDLPRSPASLTAHKILELDYEAFLKKDFDGILNRLNISVADKNDRWLVLEDAYKTVEKLTPYPIQEGRVSASTLAKKEPDFIVSKNGDTYTVRSCENVIPKIIVNDDLLKKYKKLKARPDQSPVELQWYEDQYKKIEDYKKDLINRGDYSEKLITYLVNAQHKYIESGNNDDIIPMLANEVAEKFGITANTVSRVASNKLIVDSDNNPIALKQLFSLGFQSENGERISRGEVKKIMKNLILNESANNPITDLSMKEQLKRHSIIIGTLSLSTLRNEMEIPDSKGRFQSYNQAGKEQMNQVWSLEKEIAKLSQPSKTFNKGDIKKLIVNLIKQENQFSPITDIQLEKRLEMDGIHVSTLQVSKLRSELKINDAKSRKHEYAQIPAPVKEIKF